MEKVDAIKKYNCPMCNEHGTLEHIKLLSKPYLGAEFEYADKINFVRCHHCTYEAKFPEFMNHTLLGEIAYQLNMR
jgi:C4-type Zn-finger protein